jgi:hypothetical protein
MAGEGTEGNKKEQQGAAGRSRALCIFISIGF